MIKKVDVGMCHCITYHHYYFCFVAFWLPFLHYNSILIVFILVDIWISDQIFLAFFRDHNQLLIMSQDKNVASYSREWAVYKI